jgi:hypothetical protein
MPLRSLRIGNSASFSRSSASSPDKGGRQGTAAMVWAMARSRMCSRPHSGDSTPQLASCSSLVKPRIEPDSATAAINASMVSLRSCRALELTSASMVAGQPPASVRAKAMKRFSSGFPVPTCARRSRASCMGSAVVAARAWPSQQHANSVPAQTNRPILKLQTPHRPGSSPMV